jgi:hypothetical protein
MLLERPVQLHHRRHAYHHLRPGLLPLDLLIKKVIFFMLINNKAVDDFL